MDIELLRTFLLIMNENSYTRAAEELFLTQSAISKRMDKLEEVLGVRLFNHKLRTINPTSQAQALLPYARDMVMAHKNLLDVMSNSHHMPSHINLGTTLFVTMNYLVPLIQYLESLALPFSLSYQQIEHKRIGSCLDSGELDMVISVQNKTDKPEAESIKLWDEHFHCIVSPDHPLAKQGRISVKDLFQYPAVLTEVGLPIRDSIEHLAAKYELRPSIKVMSSSFLTLQQLVREGLGWTILPEPVCSPDLIRLNCAELFKTIPTCIYVHKERSSADALQALTKALMAWKRLAV